MCCRDQTASCMGAGSSTTLGSLVGLQVKSSLLRRHCVSFWRLYRVSIASDQQRRQEESCRQGRALMQAPPRQLHGRGGFFLVLFFARSTEMWSPDSGSNLRAWLTDIVRR